MKPKYIRVVHPSGYPVLMEVEPDDPKLAALIDQLNHWGFRPDLSGDSWLRTPDGQPICPRHNVPMAQREKQGDTWYSHKVTTRDGRELYCRGYPGPTSPGWEASDISVAEPVDRPSRNGNAPAAPQPPVDPPESPSFDPDLLDQINDELFPD